MSQSIGSNTSFPNITASSVALVPPISNRTRGCGSLLTCMVPARKLVAAARKVVIITLILAALLNMDLKGRQVRLLGAGLNSRIPFPARQREAALLQVGVEVVIDLGAVPGRVVDEAPTITFPGLGRMLQEGVEGEKLLLCIDDRPRKPSTAFVLSPLNAVLVGPFLGDALVLDP